MYILYYVIMEGNQVAKIKPVNSLGEPDKLSVSMVK